MQIDTALNASTLQKKGLCTSADEFVITYRVLSETIAEILL